MAKIYPKTVFEARAEGDTPEHPSLSFATTDLQGGNQSHGAKAELTLGAESTGCYTIIVEAGGKTVFELPTLGDNFVVHIVARGDFEITGLAEALVELGVKTWPLVDARHRRDRDERGEEAFEVLMQEHAATKGRLA